MSRWTRTLARSIRTLVLVSAALILMIRTPRSARATDWPQWRGPDRDGLSRETGLLKDWPKDGPPSAWKASGIGEGMGGVAIAAGRIYTTGDTGDSAWLFALNE